MKKYLILGAVVLLAAGILGGATLVYAQNATPTPQAGSGNAPGGMFGRGMRGDPAYSGLRAYILEAEAAEFGMTADELTALYEEGKSLRDVAIEQNLTVAEFEARLDAALQAALENAVADGVLTQEEADTFLARRTDRPEKELRGNDANHPLYDYMLAAKAEAFGMTVEELQALYDEGKTLKDVAIEQNLTVAEFEAKMEAAHTNAINAALEDGAITQEQADWMLTRPQGRGGPGGMRGEMPGGMPGGRFGGGMRGDGGCVTP